MNDIPRHTYETTDGTEPREYVEHEPRTIRHSVDGELVSMMTEISDGTFVNWTHCRKCAEIVDNCNCPGGPVEAPYIQRWRDERFTRSFNTRPEPEYQMLPSVVAMMRSRGYDVLEPGATNLDLDSPIEDGLTEDDVDFARETLGDEASDAEVEELAHERVVRDGSVGATVDAGLDAALTRVRGEQTDVGF